MTRSIQMIGGVTYIVDDEAEFLDPEDRMALVAILEDTIFTNIEITDNGDGTFTYSFDCLTPKANIIKLKGDQDEP